MDAKGDFFAKKANFKYQGFDIDIFDAYIQLDNYDVKINNMLAEYEDIITAKIDTHYNAKDGAGVIDFKINKVDCKKFKTSLNTNKKPLNLKYIISKKQDEIHINNSLWKIDNEYATVNKITLPFNLNTGKLKIPSTQITLGEFTKADVSGDANLKEMKLDLNIDLLELNLADIKLTKKTPLTLSYDKNLNLTSNQKIDFKINSQKSFLDKLNIEVNDNILKIKNSYINIGNIFKTNISVNYFLEKENAQIEINNTLIENQKFGLIYLKEDKTNFNIYTKNNNIIIDSKELNLLSEFNNEGWNIDINSLSSISKNSKLLQKYFIKDANLSISKLNNEQQINIDADIKYPYKILVLNNKEIENYSINGKFYLQDNTAYINVNDIVNININKDAKIDIDTHNIGMNINAILNIVDKISDDSNSSDSSNLLNVSIETKDSYLYISDKRKVISESMKLRYLNNILILNLKHYKGTARLILEKDKLYVHGEKFNDKFMEKLFLLSDFKGGTFEFDMNGTIKNYDGIFTVNNTIVLDYKILNNILAFVNTVPSLLTFSIPGYDKKGLKVNLAYMKFKSKNNILNISDIYMDSKEIDIFGKGKANFIDDTLDLKLNLKSDLGSKISKIPLVGYLLMGEDSISTTLSITGKLSDPDIKSLIAKDIAVIPLNILKRTITLPYKLFQNSDNNNTKKN